MKKFLFVSVLSLMSSISSLTALADPAISTEHPIGGVGKTDCSFVKEDILKMHDKGIYYVAVPEPWFQQGKACGKIIEVTVGGACFENHDLGCTKDYGNASLQEFQNATGQAPPNNNVKLFVADSCGSCKQDGAIPHFDITDQTMKGNGPLAALRSYLEKNLQAVKQNGTQKTGQPNNLYISSFTIGGCAPGLKFEQWRSSVPCATGKAEEPYAGGGGGNSGGNGGGGGSSNDAPSQGGRDSGLSGNYYRDPYNGAMYPNCRSGVRDTGGGWGWQDKGSCKIGNSVPSWKDPKTNQAFAVCDPNAADAGGGFGWKGKDKCKILGAHGYWKDGYSGVRYPYCGPGAKDTGKRWGWENNSSCKIP